VPVRVKLRVAVIVAIAIAVTSAPALFVRPITLGAILSAAIALALAYVAWILWPRFTWPIPARLLRSLADGDGPPVRLSFDDGPTPLTAELLDLLKAHDVRATFFLLTAKARRLPELVARMRSEGHQIGLHGEDHRTAWFRSARELTDSLTRAKVELEQLVGAPVTLYRPSHGWKTISLVRATAAAGLELCFWHDGVWDTDAPPPSLLAARLDAVRERADRPRVVVLHDGLNDAPEPPPHGRALLDALAEWLPSLRQPAPLAPSRKSLLTFLPGVIVTVLAAWLLRSLDLRGVASAIRQTPPGALALLALATLSATVLQGARFRLLLPAGLSTLRHIGLTFALHAGNILLPLRGGSLLRPLYLARWRNEVSLPAAIGAQAADKAIEVLCLVPFLIAASRTFASDERLGTLRHLALPLALTAGALAAAFAIWRLRQRGARELPALGAAIVLSLAMWGANWLIFRCVLPDGNIALAVLVGVNVSLALPSLPAGLGTYEAAFIAVGGLSGWPADRLLAAALLSHVVQIVATLAIGLPLLATWGWPTKNQGLRVARSAD
jgi:peptidoglycan/xylan/chitin deacetylase (PgdA/CDA1 family)/uncharacterized membrane protein YbhN (UPF0104 family)